MRLYDTLTRRIEELPPPPGPIRMYFCGPTVYAARAHRQRAAVRARHVAAQLARASAATTSTLVHNITDINDKIYDAAPGRERRARRARRPSWYLEDTGDLGLGHARPPAARRPSTSRRSSRSSRSWSTRGYAYEVDGDVYFRVACDPDYGAALGPAARPGRGAGAERAQGGPARLRALEGEQARRGHVRGTRRGAAAGRAGTSSAR